MLQIFCDFDGTISNKDSLKELFFEFIPVVWAPLGERMHSGAISEREALTRAFPQMPISRDEALTWVLERVQIDPSFKSFVNWCKLESIDLSILSGGLHLFIHELLARENLSRLPIHANQVDENWNFLPKFEKALEACGFSHCKCKSLELLQNKKRLRVYIGDGFTDLCPAMISDIVFAKNSLLEHCRQENIPHFKYENFDDIQRILKSRIDTHSRD